MFLYRFPLSFACVLLACLYAVTPLSAAVNNRPIIGIVTMPVSNAVGEKNHYIPAAYVKWLEQAGARVVPVPFDADQSTLKHYFMQTNGLVLTGGGLDMSFDLPYYQNVRYLYNLAVAANEANDIYPLWGTCQGFQVMNLLAAQPDKVTDLLRCTYDSENLLTALDFTSDAMTSKLFSSARLIPSSLDELNVSLFDALATQPATMNLHHCAVTPVDFAAHTRLSSTYTILSTNVDRQNVTFVSSMEAKYLPFWAVQWHPERNQYEWDDVETLSHSELSVNVATHVARVFLHAARQNQHHFDTERDERNALFYQYQPTYTGQDPAESFPDQQIYYLGIYANGTFHQSG